MQLLHRVSLLGSLGLFAASTQAQVTLTGPGHYESFDDLGAGLPPGWSVRTHATATSPGVPATFANAAYAWSGTGGGFHNYASTDGLGSGASTTLQTAASDRALGVRQSSSVGDPGAAFVFQAADTLGYRDFTVAFSFHLVDEEGRTGTWTVDYALGSNPTAFAALGTFSRDSWGRQPESFALPGDVNHQAETLWIRLTALTPATGTGSRDGVAIDDFQLSGHPVAVVPEPAAWAVAAGLGLLGLAGWRRTQRRP